MIKDKHKGSCSELIAVIWFLNNGYDVFRNVSAHGKCDIIAEKDSTITKVDVKTATNRNGNLFCAGQTKEQKKENIKILMVDPANNKCAWREDVYFDEETRECENCGASMQITNLTQRKKRFCSKTCKGKFHYKLNKDKNDNGKI